MSVVCQSVNGRVLQPYGVQPAGAEPVHEAPHLSRPALFLFMRLAVELVGIQHDNCLQSQCVDIGISLGSLHPRLARALLVIHVPTV